MRQKLFIILLFVAVLVRPGLAAAVTEADFKAEPPDSS